MTLDLPGVTAALTTVPAIDADLAALAAAVRAQADLQAIRDLGVLYARAVDDHDLDTLVAMFTPDGVFERRGVAATGRREIRAAYVASFDTYRTMLHTAAPRRGAAARRRHRRRAGRTGTRSWRRRARWCWRRYRYEDDLRRVDGRWLFARRSITFMYAVPADQLATSFGSAERIRWPRTTPEAGDYPETSPTWDTYRG